MTTLYMVVLFLAGFLSVLAFRSEPDWRMKIVLGFCAAMAGLIFVAFALRILR